MKKKYFLIGGIIIILLVVIFIFTTTSITRQGINYKVRAINIPLYLKLHNFFDRHMNYGWMVDQIINDGMTDQQKAEAIYEWTIRHILRQPSQLPVVDDHVWNIIVRGYGISEQMADVFATLSNYAGLKSFFITYEGVKGSVPNSIVLAAVYFDGAWHICDLYSQTVFLNKQNKWASISELAASDLKDISIVQSMQNKEKKDIYYQNYFKKLSEFNYDHLYRQHRSALQNPLSRFRHFLKDGKI